jgi:hypothetical protein
MDSHEAGAGCEMDGNDTDTKATNLAQRFYGVKVKPWQGLGRGHGSMPEPGGGFARARSYYGGRGHDPGGRRW